MLYIFPALSVENVPHPALPLFRGGSEHNIIKTLSSPTLLMSLFNLVGGERGDSNVERELAHMVVFPPVFPALMTALVFLKQTASISVKKQSQL